MTRLDAAQRPSDPRATRLTRATHPKRARPSRGANPITRLAVSAIIGSALVVSIDSVSASVALLGELLLLPFVGLAWRRLWFRTAPVWVAAVFASVTTLLYGRTSGQTHVTFWLVTISDGSIELALATFLRILAIALPAVVLFANVDATDLADGLSQLLRLPSRFVLGALAGLRLAGLCVEDWRALELARRARGIADGNVVRRWAGQGFALLVISIRRGTKLATAMEARGFGSSCPRSWARRSTLRGADAMLMVIGVAIATTAVTVSVAVGAWNPVFGG